MSVELDKRNIGMKIVNMMTSTGAGLDLCRVTVLIMKIINMDFNVHTYINESMALSSKAYLALRQMKKNLLVQQFCHHCLPCCQLSVSMIKNHRHKIEHNDLSLFVVVKLL